MTTHSNRRLPTLLLVLVALWLPTPPTAAEEIATGPLPEAWPQSFRVPEALIKQWQIHHKGARKLLKGDEPHIYVWTPPAITQLRAVMLVPANTDLVRLAEHQAIREVATRFQVGIIYLLGFSGAAIERLDPPELAEASFATILEQAATVTGIANFRTAPWITVGKSSRGRFAFRPAWAFPGRVLASITYHGEVPTWPTAAWVPAASLDDSVLHCAINGLSEWDGTWFRHVRPGLLNYHRQSNWLAHQAVIMGVDHGYYPDYYIYPTFGHPMPQKMPGVPPLARCVRTWDYLAVFLEKALTLRLPPDASDDPVTLQQVDRSSGILLHPRAIEEILGLKWFALEQDTDGEYQIIKWLPPNDPKYEEEHRETPVYDDQQGQIPFADLAKEASAVPAAERAEYMWFADYEQLAAWLDLHNTHKVKERVLAPLAK